MTDSTQLIHTPEVKIGEVYATNNILIRLLANAWLKKIKDILKKINASSLNGLDVGCAEGYTLGYFYEKGVIGNMTAIDIETDKIEYAREHYPYCTYLQGDAHNLEFAENQFDYIIATEVLEHLPDPSKALKEFRRVTKPGSDIIISVPHEPFFHWGNIMRGKYWDRGGRTPTHVHFWHRHEFRNFLSQYLTIEEEHYILNFPWMLYRCKNI